jgi:hypothetical protein
MLIPRSRKRPLLPATGGAEDLSPLKGTTPQGREATLRKVIIEIGCALK